MHIVPKTWYGRLFMAILTILLLWLSMFFFTLFLIALSVLTFVLGTLLLLTHRKMYRKASQKIIEVEYSVKKPKKECKDTKKLRSKTNIPRCRI